MRKIILIATIALALLGITFAQQCEVRHYSTKLVPACNANDLRIKWPNHEDQTTYHHCAGVGNPQLLSCPTGQVFTYVLQICTTCDRYLPPVECERLPTQQPPRCISVGGGSVTPPPETPGSSYPTPHYPTGSPGEGNGNGNGSESTDDPNGNPSTDDPNGNPSTDDPNGNPSTDDPNGNPSTDDPNSTDIPPPPSPSPNDPNMPTPSTEMPTPPTAPATPPLLGWNI